MTTPFVDAEGFVTSARLQKGGETKLTVQDKLLEMVGESESMEDAIMKVLRHLEVQERYVGLSQTHWSILVPHVLPAKNIATILIGFLKLKAEELEDLLETARVDNHAELGAIAEKFPLVLDSITNDFGGQVGQQVVLKLTDVRRLREPSFAPIVNELLLLTSLWTATFKLVDAAGVPVTEFERKVSNSIYVKERVIYKVEANGTMFGLMVAICSQFWDETEGMLQGAIPAPVQAAVDDRSVLCGFPRGVPGGMAWTSTHFVKTQEAMAFFSQSRDRSNAAALRNQGVTCADLKRVCPTEEDYAAMQVFIRDHRNHLAAATMTKPGLEYQGETAKLLKYIEDKEDEEKFMCLILSCRPEDWGQANRTGNKGVTKGFRNWDQVRRAESQAAMLAVAAKPENGEALTAVYTGVIEAAGFDLITKLSQSTRFAFGASGLNVQEPGVYLTGSAAVYERALRMANVTNRLGPIDYLKGAIAGSKSEDTGIDILGADGVVPFNNAPYIPVGMSNPPLTFLSQFTPGLVDAIPNWIVGSIASDEIDAKIGSAYQRIVQGLLRAANMAASQNARGEVWKEVSSYISDVSPMLTVMVRSALLLNAQNVDSARRIKAKLPKGLPASSQIVLETVSNILTGLRAEDAAAAAAAAAGAPA